MRVENMTKRERYFYKYFPIIAFSSAFAGELLIRIVPIFGDLRCYGGYLLLVIWPAALLFWLVILAIKKPQLTGRTYYLLMIMVFCTFAFAVLTPLISKLLGVSPEAGREFVGRKSGWVMGIIFIALAIYQLWVRRYWNKTAGDR